MKAKINKKTVLIITAILVVVVVMGGIFGYQKYNEKLIAENSKKINEKITADYNGFTKEGDRTKKVKSLEDMIKASEEYEKDNSKFGNQKNVKDHYAKAISDMKKWFTEDYEKSISENTIAEEELAAESDKEKINSVKTNLQIFMETMNSEKTLVLTKEEIENYTESVNALISKYDGRVKVIEEEEARKAAEEEAKRKAEEEAKKKAEEEAREKAEAEATTAAANNSSGSSSASGSSSNSSGSSSSGGSSGRYVVKTESYTSEYGTTTTYYYSDGTTETVFSASDGSSGTIEDPNGDIWG